MKNNKVVYTAIIGGYDNLTEPSFKPDGWDFVCFTNNNISSDIWEIRNTLPLYSDNTRTARKHKLLTHRFLPEYDYSLWIDGNILIRDDINELLKYLDNANYATFNHMENVLDPRDCVYDEAKAILDAGNRNLNKNPHKGMKAFKDNPELIIKQMNRYKEDSYPENNGLVVQMEVLRRHNEKDVINAMEKQWIELKHNSKREQLSFNYTAWKTGLKFNYISGDSRDNKHFLNVGKHKGKEKIKLNNDFAPISLDYFLNMEIAGGGESKMIVRPEGINTIKDMIDYWKKDKNIQNVKQKLKPSNWQYYNCMMGGFKHDVDNHHDIGWESLTEEYYNQKKDMTDEELTNFLIQNPVEFENGFVKHSYHRACAMVGRLVSGKKYIPFYMKKDLIFDTPREKDGRHRVLPLISNLKCLNLIDELKIPKGEFTICQSGILALMGIRKNDDLDIIISSEARKQLFDNNQQFIRYTGGYAPSRGEIDIFEPNKSKFRYFGAQGDDDLINNYSFQVDGYNFLEPRFYFSRKRKDREKDIKDWQGIRKFFDTDNHKGYPFDNLTEKQWGTQWV